MAFKPQPIRDKAELSEVILSVNKELAELARALDENPRIPTNTAEPLKPRNGDLVYADGVEWNPGDGEGFYAYFDGDWQKLQNGDFQSADQFLNDLAALGDPGADRLLGWDESFNEPDWFTLVAPLNISGTNVQISAATTSDVGVVEKATAAEVAATTADKYLAADHLATTAVALTDAAPVAVDWQASPEAFTLTVTAARQIGNPSNEIPYQYRVITVQGNNSTPRTITFGSEFLGDVPTITDVTSTVWYDLYIRCIAASHFSVSAKKVLG